SEHLLTDALPDGGHRERSTHYHMITLRTFVGVRENARRFGVTLPDGYDERLARACEFALHCHRPDGGIPALSDADGGSYLGLLERAGGLLGRPDFLWASTAGGRGAPPEECGPSFPLGGYFMQRSGWGANGTPFRDERFLVFDCGPLGDGSHGPYDLLNVQIAPGGRPLLVHPGRPSSSQATPKSRRRSRRTAAPNTAAARVARATGVTLVVAPARTPRLEPGWVAESYGVKRPAPVVSVAVDGMAEVTFTTLVVPLASDGIPPTLAVHASDDATVVEVR